MCLTPLPDLECPVPLLASAIGPCPSARPCILKAAMEEAGRQLAESQKPDQKGLRFPSSTIFATTNNSAF